MAQVALPPRGRYGLGHGFWHGRRGPYFNRRGRRRGTLMRHFLASRAVAALALRVPGAPGSSPGSVPAARSEAARARWRSRRRNSAAPDRSGCRSALPRGMQHRDSVVRSTMGPGAGGRLDASAHFVKDYGRNDRAGLRGGGATLGMTWRFEPVSRLRCHRPSLIVRASATRVPNALPPDCTNTPPPAIGVGQGAFPVALRAPSNAP